MSPVLSILLAVSPALVRPPADPAEIAIVEAGPNVAVYVGHDRWLVDVEQASHRFHAAHGDGYDVLVVFADFPILTDGGAFYEPVSNATVGLNVDRGHLNPETFDHSADYGAEALAGVILVGSLAELPDDPGMPFLDEPSASSLLSQELGHRFGVFVRFLDATGVDRDDLLGRDLVHWSFFVDTGGSPLGGNRWEDADGGRFETAEPTGRWSGLDLYLFGLLPPDEVGPLRVLLCPCCKGSA